MRVLSFAAVGSHGRECCTRIAASFLLTTALAGQPPSAQDVAAELAAKISAAIPPGQSVALSIGTDDSALREELTASLRTRGVTVSSGEAAVRVHVSCGWNLRDRVCVSEITKGGERQVLSATRPRAIEQPSRMPMVGLQLQPLVAQREPILDAIPAGDELLVLQPSGVAQRSRSGASSAPILASIPSHRWPRDLRGRLRLAAPQLSTVQRAEAGPTATAFEAFLPGVVCRGRLKPLTLACSDDTEPWPMAIENSGISASRNYFTTPEGFAFYGAASIAKGAPGRWIAVDRFGVLTLLDERRNAAGRVGMADDVVRLAAPCTDGTFVATASRGDGVSGAPSGFERIDLYEVVSDRLTPRASVPVPGVITALWPGTSDAATLVVRSADSSRYEAFHVNLSCAR